MPRVEPEALMRSRFTAFVKRDADYLWKTLHSQHEARRQDEAEWKAALLRDAPSYTSLRIVETAEPDGDGVARVLFVVRYRAKERARVAAELSFFAQEDAWRYIDGILTDAASATSIAAVEGR